MKRPLLSMVLIAKDEAHNIERCFDSWWSDVDEVVLVDTGSTDGTVQAAKDYAARKRGSSKLVVGEYAWHDDFAAARTFADGLASGDWLTWCDLDDEVHGLAKLREFAGQASDEVVAFFCAYDYARDAHGNCLSELWRERVVRNDGTEWSGRLHEHKLFTRGAVVKVDPGDARWVHQREHDRDGENDRNVRILKRWLDEQPDDPRVLSSLGLEYVGSGKHADAADMFDRYLKAGAASEPADRRCQAARYLAVMLLQQGDAERARRVALDALAWDWTWADTHLSLAETSQTLGRPQEGYLHAKTALELGKPNSLLILNPLQYTAHPRALMAVCLAQLGKLDEALRLADEVLEICPSYGLIAANVELWRATLQRERAVGAFSACAKLLADSGEAAKALSVLQAAPAGVVEDPRLIDARAQLRRTIRTLESQPTLVDPDGAAAKLVARELRAAA